MKSQFRQSSSLFLIMYRVSDFHLQKNQKKRERNDYNPAFFHKILVILFSRNIWQIGYFIICVYIQ
jgi:hypothetical protein